MSDIYKGRLTVRVTANGCGLPLTGAVVTVCGRKYIIKENTQGFSPILEIFSSEEKGIKHTLHVFAECDGFQSLSAENVPITSGYLTVWNMPLEKL